MNSSRRPRLLLAWMVTVASAVVIQAAPAGASEPINGGGSTWSAVAIQQWQSDIARQGLTVNYQPVGSTAGRSGYYSNQYDFGVSEIPFQALYCPDPKNPGPHNSNCTNEQNMVHRPYVYMPIVAGGTSFLYNLHINGQRFNQLRLSPKTLTEMFTGVITSWDAADVAADNPGVALPHTAVTPVVRADGSGTSYQFSAFMAAEQPALWNTFCHNQGIPDSPCPPTSQYPQASGFVAQNGSDLVANFVQADYNDGAIGYAEAAYGIQRGVPLASIKNASGTFAQPTGVNVAVALTTAVINADHTQNLQAVYTNPDSRAYPVSSYSYMIVPTGPVTPPMDTSKGATIGAFILYFLCQGQQEADPLGYSPLPPNLVTLGFSVEQQIPGAPAPPPINQCNNPTVTGGYLTKHNISAPTVAGSIGGTNTASKNGATTKSNSGTGTTRAGAATQANQVNHVATATTTPGSIGPAGTLADAGPASTLVVAASSQSFGQPWRPISVLSLLLAAFGLVGVILLPPAASVLRKRRRTG